MFNSVIAKEGQKAIFFAFVAMIISILIECEFLVFITFVITLGLIFIFRNSQIKYNNISSDIVTPISGTVTAIDIIDEKKVIYIDVSLCNNHILRATENGDCQLNNQRGINMILNSYKATKLNEKATIRFPNSQVQLISSIFNIPINISKQKELRKGEKLGVFLQGQVSVSVDKINDIVVEIGGKVKSGESTLAIMPIINQEKEK